MPKAPVPSEIAAFISAPRPAIVGTVRPDGAPSTTATWYDWDGSCLMLSMVATGPRARNVRNDPRISLTILGDSWYDHVSLLGKVIRLREDRDLADLDRLSMRYWAKPYPKRELECVTAIVQVERWHAWGDPAQLGPPSTTGRP
ncbi:pyridoxamine 5'-phosphate oxidase family protein [Thermoactinospora rubra]|uniref:pyridoxamine 5'-phosphate oxidase family protein n=1 Tax=Thermoactinospora rubra TaxID=1088767 RepID=UPI000A104C3C|nr:pyridoxamine 5'-phosphate oxidase family protein [Thermoactinospora rubra]